MTTTITQPHHDISPCDAAALSQSIHQGLTMLYQYYGRTDTPRAIDHETIAWALTAFESVELMHMVSIIAAVATRGATLEPVARYALTRADGAAFTTTERAIFDVLLDALHERGHTPEVIARMLQNIFAPVAHALNLPDAAPDAGAAHGVHP